MSSIKTNFMRLKKSYDEGGLSNAIYKILAVSIRNATEAILNFYFKLVPSRKFEFNGKKLSYFRHCYNRTYQNERMIEIPIAMDFLSNLSQGARILEVGNVLNNYSVSHKRDILDKYDLQLGIINEDIVDFHPESKYDAILSISTFEHVGWDEEIKSEDKIPKAICNLKNNALNMGGVIFITAPLDYNAYLDALIKQQKNIFDEIYYMKRISSNEWIQSTYDETKDMKFNDPYKNASGLIVAIVKN